MWAHSQQSMSLACVRSYPACFSQAAHVPGSSELCAFAEHVPFSLLQGVKQVRSDGSERFLLCDPAIHCAKHPARFSNTNLGQEGINRFFATHKCNAICAQLGLPAAAGAARTTSGSRLVGTKLPGTRLIGTKVLSAKLPGSGLLGSKLLSSAH